MTTEAPADPMLLTAEQVDQFDRDGYLVLRNRIPADLLARLQDASAAWMLGGETADHDVEFDDSNGGHRMFRINYVHDKGQPASLELLGSPAILGIAESLAGPSFVPTYESLVFKNEGDGAPIRWHQDAVHPRNHRIFNVDIYLDQSVPEGGALRVIPGSQLSGDHDLCALEAQHGWDVPGVVITDLEPGDVLLHDVMIVHGSPDVVGNALRRTIYYEFRAAEQIESEGPWDRDWVDARLRMIPPAIAEYNSQHPDEPGYTWRIEDRFRPEDAELQLRMVHPAHTPGGYCSLGSVELATAGER